MNLHDRMQPDNSWQSFHGHDRADQCSAYRWKRGIAKLAFGAPPRFHAKDAGLNSLRRNEGVTVSHQYPASSDGEPAPEARLPDRIPALRAGYLTTLGSEALAEASKRLAVTLVGGRADGFGSKSAGAIVARSDGTRYWLKVSGLVGRATDTFRDAEIESRGLPSLSKPTIVATTEWNDYGIFWRAVLMRLAPSPAASLLPWCRAGSVRISGAWLAELRSALTTLRRVTSARRTFSPDQIAQMIVDQIGSDAPVESNEWHVGHGDLHWSNLTTPQFMLLDWEHWGLVPRGFDIGRLLGCSAFAPAVMGRIADAFADDFDSSAGRVGLLAGIASVKGHIPLGELDPAAGRLLQPLIDRILGMEREHRRPLRRIGRWLSLSA